MRLKSVLFVLVLTMACGAWAVAQSADLSIVKEPQAVQVTGTSAVVTWTTNAQSSATVNYGTDRNNLDQTAQAAWGGPVHQVTLNNLKPNTTYYFRVTSGQGKTSGTGDIAAIRSFMTRGEGSIQAATTGSDATQATSGQTGTQASAAGSVNIVDGPRIENVDDNSAVIAWTTDKPSSAVVRYGTDRNNLTQTAQEQWGGSTTDRGNRTHRVQVRNLNANTTYYFSVESAQAQGGGGAVAKSDITTLQTKTKEAAASAYQSGQSGTSTAEVKLQAGPVPQNVTDTAATLWIMTPDDAALVVKYGTNKNSLDKTAQSPTGKEHEVRLTGLQPSATYFFEVTGADGKSRESGQFQTENANFASETRRVRLTKGPIIEYIDRDNAVVAWSTNVRASSIVRYGTDPNNLSQTAQAPWGQETHRVEIRNLTPATKYYFVVESAQAQGTGTLAKSNPAPFNTVAPGQQAMRNPEQR